ncbi:MAG: hypothetical protein K6C99_06175 [Lachnospiraceae bacterium]|nr:hypothetical protein [Lachnospiraceae bacterium]
MKKNKKHNGNREYKSDLFSMLMHEKKYALETYNAINNSDYKDPEAIEILRYSIAESRSGLSRKSKGFPIHLQNRPIIRNWSLPAV